MTHEQIIAELVRIWNSPHLDLSLKAGLAEAIETLKEKNQSDSLVTDSSDDCKESESKLELISRADAIDAIEELPNAYNGWSDAYDKACIIGALEEVPSAEPKAGHWIDEETNYLCSKCHRGCWVNSDYCPWCGADMRGKTHE